MQKWLSRVCHTLDIKAPSYFHEDHVQVDGRILCRFVMTTQNPKMGGHVIVFGRFSKHDHATCEEVVFMLLDQLLQTTGFAINDFNHYKVMHAMQHVTKLESDMHALAMENASLKQQLAAVKNVLHGNMF